MTNPPTNPPSSPRPPIRSSERDPFVGQTADGRYLIRAFEGQGRFARVYRARDQRTHTHIAVKRFMITEPNAGVLMRFRAATSAAAKLEHPRVVTLTDFAIVNREPIIAMEWIKSPTLAEHLSRSKRMRAGVVTQMGVWLAKALAYIHSREALHLDLTPRNIFLDTGVGVRIADVGLVQIVGNSPPKTQLSAERILPYLAPEQMTPTPPTPATDVYALGVILFQSLTGRVPFSPEAVMARHNDQGQSRRALPRPSDYARGVPELLDEVVTSCLFTDPLRRPADGEDLAERLSAASRETPESALIYLSRATAAFHAMSGPRRAVTGARRAITGRHRAASVDDDEIDDGEDREEREARDQRPRRPRRGRREAPANDYPEDDE